MPGGASGSAERGETLGFPSTSRTTQRPGGLSFFRASLRVQSARPRGKGTTSFTASPTFSTHTMTHPDAGAQPRHVSVLPAEVLAALSPQPGQVLVDATVGAGGHA